MLALDVKGTLRPGAIPRLTPSRMRQMSRVWLNGPDNPAMADWNLEGDDLYAGVMVVDLALAVARTAVSGDFESYMPISDLAELQELRGCSPRRRMRTTLPPKGFHDREWRSRSSAPHDRTRPLGG